MAILVALIDAELFVVVLIGDNLVLILVIKDLWRCISGSQAEMQWQGDFRLCKKGKKCRRGNYEGYTHVNRQATGVEHVEAAQATFLTLKKKFLDFIEAVLQGR